MVQKFEAPEVLRIWNASLKQFVIFSLAMNVSTMSATTTLAAPSQKKLTATLIAAKKSKCLSFADLEASLGLDDVWIASLFYGQAMASK